ncbi:MAG: outer membrane beta-barrel protein [bacterium]|nr:MAG: outer membrane beta-barrel protein [bacterium]
MTTFVFNNIFKIIILIAVAVSIAISRPVLAQEKANLEFLLGFNASKINGGYLAGNSGMTPSNYNLGFQLGLSLRYKYASFVDLLPQVEFIKKGSKWGQPTLAIIYEGDYINYEISYVQFTLNHAFHLCSSRKRGLDFLLGIYGAYKLNASERWVFENTPEGGLPPGNLNDYLSDWDAGLSLGIRLFSMKSRVSLMLRYDHGLKQINNTAEKRALIDFEEKSSQRMRGIFLTIGIKLKSYH